MSPEHSTFEGLIPAELTQAIRAGRCVLFAGAGLSAQVTRSTGKSLPNWSGLLAELLEWAVARQVNFWGASDDIRDMIAKGSLLAAAQELQERVAAPELGRFFSQVFRDPGVMPAAAHRLLPQIAFRAVLTTNYDTLIEGAYSLEQGGRIPPVYTQDDLAHRPSPLRADDFFIFKLHGHLDRPDSIVLGSRDYQEVLFRTPGYRQFLETLFATHTVLFVGFGGADPDLDNVLDRLASIYTRTLDRHFLLLPAGRLNPTEKRRFLLDRRVEVIEYLVDHSHSQVVAFLSELKRQTDAGVTSVLRAAEEDPQQLRVFVSHSMKDTGLANEIVSLVRELGFAPWTAEAWAPSAEASEMRQQISEAISTSDVFVLVFSRNAAESKWVNYEAELATVRESDGRLTVVPVLVDDVALPSYLRDRQAVRLDRSAPQSGLVPLVAMLQRLAADRAGRTAGNRRRR